MPDVLISVTLTQQLLSEDPDRIIFNDLPGFGKDRQGVRYGSRSFQDDDCIVFGLLKGVFRSAWGQEGSEGDELLNLLEPGLTEYMIHAKLYLAYAYDSKQLAELTAGFKNLVQIFRGTEIFTYDTWGEFEADNIDAMDHVREYGMGEWWESHPEPEDSDSPEWQQWVDEQDEYLGLKIEEIWQEVQKYRKEIVSLWFGDEDGSNGSARDRFELPGRAWQVTMDDGVEAVLVSFWGSAVHPRLEEILGEIRYQFGMPDAPTWYEDDVNGEWVDASAPAAVEEPVDLDPEIVAQIKRLSARMHTASPEEKEKIRALVAQLRTKLGGKPVDPKAGAGSKRAGRSAAAAGFDHAAGFHAARRHEAVIRALEEASYSDLPERQPYGFWIKRDLDLVVVTVGQSGGGTHHGVAAAKAFGKPLDVDGQDEAYAIAASEGWLRVVLDGTTCYANVRKAREPDDTHSYGLPVRATSTSQIKIAKDVAVFYGLKFEIDS